MFCIILCSTLQLFIINSIFLGTGTGTGNFTINYRIFGTGIVTLTLIIKLFFCNIKINRQEKSLILLFFSFDGVIMVL